jgi:hypothetical protein
VVFGALEHTVDLMNIEIATKEENVVLDWDWPADTGHDEMALLAQTAGPDSDASFHSEIALIIRVFQLDGSGRFRESGPMSADSLGTCLAACPVARVVVVGGTHGLDIFATDTLEKVHHVTQVAMGGTVINLDAPHYISLVIIHRKHNEGCLNDSAAPDCT